MNLHLLNQVAQVLLGVFLIVLIMVQAKGAGLSRGIGNSIGFYSSRRGLEKVIFYATIIAGILFVANSFALVIL